MPVKIINPVKCNFLLKNLMNAAFLGQPYITKSLLSGITVANQNQWQTYHNTFQQFTPFFLYHSYIIYSAHVYRNCRKQESEVQQSCLALCDPMDCSLPVASVHVIFQARILEWVSISFPRGSPQPRDRTQVSSTEADSFPSEPPGKPRYIYAQILFVLITEIFLIPVSILHPRQNGSLALTQSWTWKELKSTLSFLRINS